MYRVDMWSKFFKRRDLVIVPMAYIILGFILYISQDSLIYLADDRPHGECVALPTAEVLHGVVRGFYVSYEGERLAVLYHGNAGNACDRAPLIRSIHGAGYAVLAVEYPGYADPEVRARGTDILANVHDVVAHVETLPYTHVVPVGESIGSAFASYHATLATTSGLVLIAPFERLSARALRAVRIYPVSLMLRQDLLVDEWARTAPSVRIIAAEHDEVIPRRHTDNVYDALDPATTEYVIIPGTSHNTLYGRDTFYEAVTDYLEGL
jgi:esterase/lipase